MFAREVWLSVDVLFRVPARLVSRLVENAHFGHSLVRGVSHIAK